MFRQRVGGVAALEEPGASHPHSLTLTSEAGARLPRPRLISAIAPANIRMHQSCGWSCGCVSRWSSVRDPASCGSDYDRRVQTRLDHCVIAVSDWERSNSFYGNVLGAELVAHGRGWAYRFGAQQLNVHGPEVSAGSVARIAVAPGNSDLCFVWDGPIAGAVSHRSKRGRPSRGRTGRASRRRR